MILRFPSISLLLLLGAGDVESFSISRGTSAGGICHRTSSLSLPPPRTSATALYVNEKKGGEASRADVMHHNLLDAPSKGGNKGSGGLIEGANRSMKTFETRFPELVRFYNKHGHSNVSRTDTDYSSLGVYVTELRSNYRKHMKKVEEGTQDEVWDQIWNDRHTRLAELDFQWDPKRGFAPTTDWSSLSNTTLMSCRTKDQLRDYLRSKGQGVTDDSGKLLEKKDLMKAIKGL